MSSGELVNIAEVLERSAKTIIDVRTPLEFAAGHIPGAINIPLFSNEERAEVGTLYKKKGRDRAVEKGLSFVGPKLVKLVRAVKEISNPGAIFVHCWRGGMRSESLCWLLKTAGLAVQRIAGGYKSYRAYIRQGFANPANIYILGGHTGSDKTALLHCLRGKIQLLDLEGLAHHKGSAFGHINEEPQPVNEQFENNLAHEWQQLDLSQPILIENESAAIGKVYIPEPLWRQMRGPVPVISVVVPIAARIDFLVQEYGAYPAEELIFAIKKLTKKLGLEKITMMVDLVKAHKLAAVCEILLDYYDVYYQRGLEKRDPNLVYYLEIRGQDFPLDAELLRDFVFNIANSHL